MGTAYIDKNEWARGQDYMGWTQYAADNSTPTENNLEEIIDEATDIINEKIGSFNTSITDARFLSRIKKLCKRMTNRMLGIGREEGKGGFFGYSQTDYLQQRERDFLHNTVGVILGYVKKAKIVF